MASDSNRNGRETFDEDSVDEILESLDRGSTVVLEHGHDHLTRRFTVEVELTGFNCTTCQGVCVILVETEEGVGSTFTVKFPAQSPN